MGIISSNWERQVDNNLFDLIAVDQFKNYRIGTLYNYLLMWILLILHTTLHCVDIYTCIKLLAFNSWSSEVKPTLPFNVSKWLFAGCIIFSIVWLIFCALKGIRIYSTRNISLTYTNEFARTLCSVGSYKKFCVLNQINPTGSFDKIAFYTYFQYSNCLGLLLADSPRQVINALTLWSVFKVESGQLLTTIKEISTKNRNEALILYGMAISFFIWIFFIAEFFFALIFTLPVYYRILQSLKFQSLRQYVCIKVDKTVKQLAREHQKKSLEKLIHSKYSYDDLLSEKPSILNVELPVLEKTGYYDLSKSNSSVSISSIPEYPFSEKYTNYSKEVIKKPTQSHYRVVSNNTQPFSRAQTFGEVQADHPERTNPFITLSKAQTFDEYTGHFRVANLKNHSPTSGVYSTTSNYGSEFASKASLHEFLPKNPNTQFPSRKFSERNFSNSSTNFQHSQGSEYPLLSSSSSQVSLTKPTQPERTPLNSTSQTSLGISNTPQQPKNFLNKSCSSSIHGSDFTHSNHEEHITRGLVRPSLYVRARGMEMEDYSKFKPHKPNL